MSTIYNLVFAALTTWAPKATPAVVEEIAEAIAESVQAVGRGEQTALELAALAVEETGLADYVVDGRCNRADWRASAEGRRVMRRGDCDGGHAVGVWQIHPVSGGPTAEALLDVHVAALFAARLWVRRPQAWTPWRLAVRMAREWRRP
jgi:hypothetical protein